MRVIILGCGSSTGVPEIGCTCPVCTSDNPRNRRSRASIFIEAEGKHILVDTSPDWRQQALANGISRVDAVLFTHDHADHTHGIDDLRMLNVWKGDVIPAYFDAATYASLSAKFSYVFLPKPEKVWYRPALAPHFIPEPLEDFDVQGVRVTPFLQLHAKSTTLGFRIGNMAYSTDANGFPEESFDKLQGLDVWIVDCLRYRPSFTHARLEQTLEWIARVKPKKAVLTHMSHEMDYAALSAELPDNVVAAYDNMELFFP